MQHIPKYNHIVDTKMKHIPKYNHIVDTKNATYT